MKEKDEMLDRFLLRFKSKKTMKDYERDLWSFKTFVEKDFLEVDHFDCLKYINELNKKVDKKELSLSTVEKLYSQLYSFFHYLEENKYIEYNYFNKIKKPTVSRNIGREKIIGWDDLDRVISILKTYKPRDYCALMLIFTSGLTLKEVVELKWNQFIIDSNNHIGIKFESVQRERFVKVHQDIWDLLIKYRESEYGFIGPGDYVFMNNRGSHITGRWLRMVIKKACQEAALDREYTPRDLRHAFVAHTLKRGASASQVKNQLGWSDSKLAERYLLAIQQLDDNAVDYLNFRLKDS